MFAAFSELEEPFFGDVLYQSNYFAYYGHGSSFAS